MRLANASYSGATHVYGFFHMQLTCLSHGCTSKKKKRRNKVCGDWTRRGVRDGIMCSVIRALRLRLGSGFAWVKWAAEEGGLGSEDLVPCSDAGMRAHFG